MSKNGRLLNVGIEPVQKVHLLHSPYEAAKTLINSKNGARTDAKIKVVMSM
jgi:hypothetical protein